MPLAIATSCEALPQSISHKRDAFSFGYRVLDLYNSVNEWVFFVVFHIRIDLLLACCMKQVARTSDQSWRQARHGFFNEGHGDRLQSEWTRIGKLGNKRVQIVQNDKYNRMNCSAFEGQSRCHRECPCLHPKYLWWWANRENTIIQNTPLVAQYKHLLRVGADDGCWRGCVD